MPIQSQANERGRREIRKPSAGEAGWTVVDPVSDSTNNVVDSSPLNSFNVDLAPPRQKKLDPQRKRCNRKQKMSYLHKVIYAPKIERRLKMRVTQTAESLKEVNKQSHSFVLFPPRLPTSRMGGIFSAICRPFPRNWAISHLFLHTVDMLLIQRR